MTISANTWQDPKPPSGSKAPRVLLVEDSRDNQVLFVRFLEVAGIRVDIAQNGLEGVRREKEAAENACDYDAIIMDIRMPVMDGYQAAARIRARGYRGPIIALTADVVAGEDQRCFASGCSHFLTKPVARHIFIETVHDAIGCTQGG